MPSLSVDILTNKIPFPPPLGPDGRNCPALFMIILADFDSSNNNADCLFCMDWKDILFIY